MPGGFLAYALAGAATGAGRGLVNEARAKREMVMEELREQRLTARDDRKFGQQMQLAEQKNQWQIERDERQHEFGMERDAFKHSLSTAGLGSTAAAGLTSDQHRQIDLIMQRYADFDAMSGSYVVNDWDGLRQALLRVDGGEQYYRQLFGEPPRPASPSQLATPQPMPQDRSQLVDGQTYRLGDGTVAVFNGREGVFEAAEAAGASDEGGERTSSPATPARPQFQETGNPLEDARRQREAEVAQERQKRRDQRRETALQDPVDAENYRELLRQHGRDFEGNRLTPDQIEALTPEQAREEGRRVVSRSTTARNIWNEMQNPMQEEATRELARMRDDLERQRRQGRISDDEYRQRRRDIERRAERFGLSIEDIE